MNLPKAVVRIGSAKVAWGLAAVVLFFFAAMMTAFSTNSSRAGLWLMALGLLCFETFYIGWLLCIGLASNSAASSRLVTVPILCVATYPVAVLYSAWAPFELFAQGTASPAMAALHLFSMVVNFSILWFASRSLHAAEKTTKPTLQDYLPSFLLLWFAPFFPPAIKWTHERVRRALGIAP